MRVLPTTELGRRAVVLAVAAVVCVLAWRILPFGAGLGFLFGLAGGASALVAIARHHERALAVYLAVVPMLQVVFFVLGELLIGHD